MKQQKRSANEKGNRRRGLADSIVYATGVIKKADVVTGDEHFKKLEGVLFINNHLRKPTTGERDKLLGETHD